MRIKKTSETTPTMASVVNQFNISQTDAYSCHYVNQKLSSLIQKKEYTGTTDGNGFITVNMGLDSNVIIGVRIKTGNDGFAIPYNIRGIDGWSVQMKDWTGANYANQQFTLEIYYLER